MTSISLSNMAVTGKDFPSLVCKNTQPSRSLLTEEQGKRVGLMVSYLHCELLPRTQAVGHHDSELLFPAQLQRIGVLLGQELKRDDAHAHQLVLVQLLEALGDDCTYALMERKARKSNKNMRDGKMQAGKHHMKTKHGNLSLPAGKVLWPPSLWSFRNHSLCLPR